MKRIFAATALTALTSLLFIPTAFAQTTSSSHSGSLSQGANVIKPNDSPYTYNGGTAVAYADQYALSPNSQYKLYSSDCTNFASQVLYHGGHVMDSTWYYYSPGSSNPQVSTAWMQAVSLYRYLCYGGWGTDVEEVPGTSTKSFNQLSAGDLVFYDFGYFGDGPAHMDHVAVETGRLGNGVITSDAVNKTTYFGDLVDAHTSNRKNVFWTLINYNQNAATTTVYEVHILG